MVGSARVIIIGGFMDTYLGRQVVSRPGPRAGWDQLGVWGSAVSTPSGVWGDFDALLALKSDIRWQQFR